jgi:broad specificity phosphatase PhoE
MVAESSPVGHADAGHAVTTVVHLVRHGEVANPDGVLYGRIPGFGLSENGRLMAKTVADYLAARDVTVVRSSPLERARQTAAPIAERFGLPVEIDERLIESWNRFEGLRVSPGALLRAPRRLLWLRNPFLPSWGEPYRAVAARMLAAAADAARAAAGHEAVCVSHQLPIWVSRQAAEGHRLWHDPRRRQCSLGSVTSLVFAGGEVAEVRYADPSGSGARRAAGA